MKTRNLQITEGTIWKQILLFFFPILLGSFFQQFYNTVDTIVVGQYAGKEALSAIGGSAAQIVSFVVGFFSGLSVGVTVIIAQYFGAKDRESMDKALHTAYLFSVIFGLVGGAICFIFSRQLLLLLNTPEETMADSQGYLQIYFAGLIFALIYNMGSGILRAIGDSRRPLYFLIVSTLVNVVLDLLFVMKLQMGARGAAYATVIAQAVSAILVTYVLMYRVEGMAFRFRRLCLDRGMLRRIMRIGLPSAIASCTYTISNMIVQAALNGKGVDVVAAWAALGRIDSLQWMINNAFGMSLTTFVGQNFGAGKMARVRKGTWQTLGMHMMTSVCIAALFLTFGKPVFSIFTNDAEVVRIGMEMVWNLAPFYWTFAFVEVFSASLRAQNISVLPTVINMICVCAFRIIWILFVVPTGTMRQMIVCYPATWILCGIMMSILYLCYTQRRKRLEQAS